MSLQGADDVDLDPLGPDPLHCACGAARRRAIPEDPKHGRTAARHYSRERPFTYKLTQHRPQRWVTVEASLLQVVSHGFHIEIPGWRSGPSHA
jgi:hypothetical protein